MHPALFSEPRKNNVVKCTLCPHFCLIQEDRVGTCAVRKNIGGKLFSLVYGKAIAYHVDPIEKKPLFHFYPGSKIYSFATAGCNFRCDFCQNWDISQISKGKEGQIIGEEKGPGDIVDEAIRSGCGSIAMTYNEPTIFFEYAYDTCVLAREKGLKTVFVSNGYITKEAIDKIAPVLNANNIDLKSFSDEFYKRACGARHKPVLDSIRHYYNRGVWIEITTLIIPGENDSDRELRQIAEFIASIDVNIPWHISRFHPDYKMTGKLSTPSETLHNAYKIGKKAGLRYIYVGNIPGDSLENTYCPKCDKLLVERFGFEVLQDNVRKGKCRYCQNEIKGFFH
jgi:pyruvate formate lyase activating enzyme